MNFLAFCIAYTLIKMSFQAFTATRQSVTIQPIEYGGEKHLITIVDATIFMIILNNAQYSIVSGENLVPLFTSTGKPFTDSMLSDIDNVELPPAKVALFFKPRSVINVTTSDPIGTKRFDDAYVVTMNVFPFKGTTIKLFRVTVAVVHNTTPSTSPGFKVGLEQPAYLFRYEYLIVADEIISRTLNIGVGNVVATENQFFGSGNKGGVMQHASTPLLESLAKAIRLIQPNSKFGNYKRSIMFWTMCVSKNIKEIYSLAGIKHNREAKFTATLRQNQSRQNLAELGTILQEGKLLALRF